MTQSFFFYIFSLFLILSSLMVIVARNPVHSILLLVFSFFTAAPLWLMLQAEFLALILVLVYVGAVMTLFLFVVMMLNLDTTPGKAGYVRYLPFGIIIIAFIVAGILYIIGPSYFNLAPPSSIANYNNAKDIGSVLYTLYIYPFELAAVLLLVAIIAAISLSLRKPRSKKQNISDQLHAIPKNRLQLMKMPVEKK